MIKSNFSFLAVFLLINVQISQAQCWKTISNGGGFYVAIASDSTLWSWGNNLFTFDSISGASLLGIGNTHNITINTPTQISNTHDWAEVNCGLTFTIAKKTDGTLWSWGYNSMPGSNNTIFYGSLGTGNTSSTVPTLIMNDSTTWKTFSIHKEMATYSTHVLAIKNDGTLWGWGNGYNYVLGTGNTNIQITPLQIESDTNWAQVVTNSLYSAGLKTDGTLWGWGYNGWGTFGLPSTFLGDMGDGYQSIPIQINTNTHKKLAALNELLTVIKTDGTLWAAGNCSYLGGGCDIGNAFTYSNYFIQEPSGSTNFNDLIIDFGSHSISAIKQDSTLWFYGYDPLTGITNNSFIQEDTSKWEHFNQGVFNYYFNSNGQIWYVDRDNNFLWTQPQCMPDQPASLSNIAANRKIKIYPNPTQSIINIENLFPTEGIISIYNSIGIKISEFKSFSSSISFDISNYSKGVYIIYIKSNRQNYNSKIVIE